MFQNAEIAEQNIITIQDGESAFFEAFVNRYGLRWSYEEKQSSILPLSKSYVGYITTPCRTISLKPKYREIGFEHIFRMYLYVYGYRPTDSPAVLDVTNAETSTDVADLFIKNLKQNIRQGIIRTYQPAVIDERTLSGRVDFPHTFINNVRQKQKYVRTRVSSLSLDNDINSLIATALSRLKYVQKYASVVSELLMYFPNAKQNVQNGSKVLKKVVFNSNTSRYRRTLVYAAMIIDQLSYNDVGASIGTDSFLINFDALFEDFVIKILKEYPEQKGFSTWAEAMKFAEVIDQYNPGGEREYQPDILYRYNPEDAAFNYYPSAETVLDVKNKAYDQFKNPDIYQILTYAKLLHSSKAVLLYPAFSQREPITLSLNPDIFEHPIINACFVSIADANGDAFLKSIRRFADTVEKIVLGLR